MDGFSLANHGQFTKYAKLSPYQTFSLYDIHMNDYLTNSYIAHIATMCISLWCFEIHALGHFQPPSYMTIYGYMAIYGYMTIYGCMVMLLINNTDVFNQYDTIDDGSRTVTPTRLRLREASSK